MRVHLGSLSRAFSTTLSLISEISSLAEGLRAFKSDVLFDLYEFCERYKQEYIVLDLLEEKTLIDKFASEASEVVHLYRNELRSNSFLIPKDILNIAQDDLQQIENTLEKIRTLSLNFTPLALNIFNCSLQYELSESERRNSQKRGTSDELMDDFAGLGDELLKVKNPDSALRGKILETVENIYKIEWLSCIMKNDLNQIESRLLVGSN